MCVCEREREEYRGERGGGGTEENSDDLLMKGGKEGAERSIHAKVDLYVYT